MDYLNLSLSFSMKYDSIVEIDGRLYIKGILDNKTEPLTNELIGLYNIVVSNKYGLLNYLD